MTTANIITVFRILLIPFFVIQMLYFIENGKAIHRLLGFLTFAIAAISDGVDGYIARRYNQRSELGAFLDPLADKLLLVCAILVLTWKETPLLHRFPFWLTGTIIGRDIIVVIGFGMIQYVTKGAMKIRPKITGKISTVLQMAAVVWSMLNWDAKAFFYIAVSTAAFTAISGLFYVYDGLKQLSVTAASSPEKS